MSLHVSLQLGLRHERLPITSVTHFHFRTSLHRALEWPLIGMNAHDMMIQIGPPRERLVAALVGAHIRLLILHRTIPTIAHYDAPEYGASIHCVWHTSCRSPDAYTGTPTSHFSETPTCGFRV